MDTKTLGIVLLLLSICCLIFVELKKRKTFLELRNKLNQRDFGGYFILLNSAFAKFVFPVYNRNYMKLNAYMLLDDGDEIDALLKEMLQMKVTKKQRIDLVNKAFNYYVEQEDQEKAKVLLSEIETFNDEKMKAESRKIYNIFLLKTHQYIKEMEQQLQNVTGVEKGFLEYVLYLQYENKGDQKKSRYYLELSQKDMIPEQIAQ